MEKSEQKSVYVQPAMRVVELKAKTILLAGSPELESGQQGGSWT